MLITIENLMCLLGMFIIEMPNNIAQTVICIIIVTILCCPFILYIMFYRNKALEKIKKDKKKDLIISVICFIVFRECMNYIYNNIMHLGDNYAIYVSILFAIIYNVLKIAEFNIFIRIKKVDEN